MIKGFNFNDKKDVEREKIFKGSSEFLIMFMLHCQINKITFYDDGIKCHVSGLEFSSKYDSFYNRYKPGLDLCIVFIIATMKYLNINNFVFTRTNNSVDAVGIYETEYSRKEKYKDSLSKALGIDKSLFIMSDEVN